MFVEFFKQTHSDKKFVDLSKIPLNELVTESSSIVNHHTNVVVFLGFLEPGWMLEGSHQVQLRKLFRKFEVGMVCRFVDSIPFSWKNEIDTLYTQVPLNYNNGNSNIINNGCPLLHQS